MESDPVLAALSPERRDTLIAQAVGEGVWSLDLVLQGARETVFFDL